MSYDPYAAASRRHANRATAATVSTDGTAEVPGNERELLDWLAAPLADPTAYDLDELARRVDLAEVRETVRGAGIRPAVMDAVEAARAVIRGDDPPTADPPPPPASSAPAADTSAGPPAAATLVQSVPATATDVVEWIRAAPAAHRAAYAAAAWAVEQQRAGNPRKTVQDETAKHLT